ncbi:MAG TPA: hypothetical protein VGN97_07455 [Mesorhizobium sp.]|jgi:hypothetical protein|nr:hypothetical protein [Mesorhizobium sp.]
MNEHLPERPVVEVSVAKLRRVLFHLQRGQKPMSPREDARLASAIEILREAADQPPGAARSASSKA